MWRGGGGSGWCCPEGGLGLGLFLPGGVGWGKIKMIIGGRGVWVGYEFMMGDHDLVPWVVSFLDGDKMDRLNMSGFSFVGVS